MPIAVYENESPSPYGWIAAVLLILIVAIVVVWAKTVQTGLKNSAAWSSPEGGTTATAWGCADGGSISVQGAQYACGTAAPVDVSAAAAGVLNGRASFTWLPSVAPFSTMLGLATPCSTGVFSGSYACV